MVAINIPALIGASCWPMFIAAFFNAGANLMNNGAGSGAVNYFQGLQVAIMLAVMSSLWQYTYWQCKFNRTGPQEDGHTPSWVEVHTPTILVFWSCLLVNIQPLLVLINGSWKLCCAHCTTFDFPEHCTATGLTYPPWPQNKTLPRECSVGGNIFWDISYCAGERYETFPTVWQGWAILIVCTWGGYALMFVGIFQATQVHTKILRHYEAVKNERIRIETEERMRREEAERQERLAREEAEHQERRRQRRERREARKALEEAGKAPEDVGASLIEEEEEVAGGLITTPEVSAMSAEPVAHARDSQVPLPDEFQDPDHDPRIDDAKPYWRK